jgi:hypothetical protein
MTTLLYLQALAVTLLLECPTVAVAYRSIASLRRSLATALAANLATHGLLWSLWPLLWGTNPAPLAAAEGTIVLIEAVCYRYLLGGTTLRALTVSALANALSVAAGFALARVRL